MTPTPMSSARKALDEIAYCRDNYLMDAMINKETMDAITQALAMMERIQAMDQKNLCVGQYGRSK